MIITLDPEIAELVRKRARHVHCDESLVVNDLIRKGLHVERVEEDAESARRLEKELEELERRLGRDDRWRIPE